VSVQELFDFQKNVLSMWATQPKAWILKANPVWGRWETMNQIAIFDTREKAEAYVAASALPGNLEPEKRTTKDRYVRTFRPDSLLWDYNSETTRPMIYPAFPWYDFSELRQNPEPPSGSVVGGPREWSPHGIPVDVPPTTHPKYGRDYDQGFGGSRTNMDNEVPEAPLEKKE